jgi:hypothetical protein
MSRDPLMIRLHDANPEPQVGTHNQQLRDHIVSQAAPWNSNDRVGGPGLGRNRVPAAGLRWGIAAGVMLAGAVAVALTVVALSGSAPSVAQAFPALSRPSTLTPAALQQSLKIYGGTAEGIDIAKGHTVQTPWGKGYVLTGPNDEFVCVVAPGLNSADWGASCAQTVMATTRGTGQAEYAYDSRTGTARLLALLPHGATATIETAGKAPRRLSLSDGVLAIGIAKPTRIAVTINGHTTTHQVFPQEAMPASGSTLGSNGSSTVASSESTTSAAANVTRTAPGNTAR